MVALPRARELSRRAPTAGTGLPGDAERHRPSPPRPWGSETFRGFSMPASTAQSVPLAGVVGFGGSGGPCCGSRGHREPRGRERADSRTGQPCAPGGRARTGPGWCGPAPAGRDGAPTLTCQSSGSGPGSVCSGLRSDDGKSVLVAHSAAGRPGLSSFSFRGRNGGVTF